MATIVAEKEILYGSPLYRRGLEQYRANLRGAGASRPAVAPSL